MKSIVIHLVWNDSAPALKDSEMVPFVVAKYLEAKNSESGSLVVQFSNRTLIQIFDILIYNDLLDNLILTNPLGETFEWFNKSRCITKMNRKESNEICRKMTEFNKPFIPYEELIKKELLKYETNNNKPGLE